MRILRLLMAVLIIWVQGCGAPETSDELMLVVQAPSGQYSASVIKRDAGLLTSATYIVFLHPAHLNPKTGVMIIAVADGAEPVVKFDSDNKLRVRLFGGTKHHQKDTALGVSITYE